MPALPSAPLTAPASSSSLVTSISTPTPSTMSIPLGCGETPCRAADPCTGSGLQRNIASVTSCPRGCPLLSSSERSGRMGGQRCCHDVEPAGLLRHRAGTAVVVAILAVMPAGCAASKPAIAIAAVHSSAARPPATATAAGRSCSGGGSGFSVSIAVGQTGAPTPAGALQHFLSAPDEPGYSAAFDQWHETTGSARSVIYSAGPLSVTISELPDRTWFVTDGQTCASGSSSPASPSTTVSH